MLRASYLASILAAARGFGSTPHAVENACRNKETPVAVSHAEMIADCVAAGIPEMDCTAELAEMQAADSVGCGAEPVKKSTYTTGGTAPSALCDCCPVEVGESEHRAALCNITEVAATCAFTCTGSGDDDICPLAIEMAGVEHDDLEGSKTSDRGELAPVLAPVHRSRRRRHPVCSEIEEDGRATH